ncbi:MAG: hypothetical protein ACREQD_15315, partial [Candidatus Binataceae bacterium]
MKQALSSGVVTAQQGDAIAFGTRRLSEALQQLADQAFAVCDSIACIIAWRSAADAGVAHAPNTLGWRAPVRAVLALVERHSEQPPSELVRLEPGELAAIVSGRLTAGRAIHGLALSSAELTTRVVVIVLAPVGRSPAGLETLARLLCEQVRALIAMDELTAARAFWRNQASATGERLAASQRELAASAAEQAARRAVIADCLKLRPRRRFAGLGARLARWGPFAAWLVAAGSEGGLRIVASATALTSLPELRASDALAE